MNKVIIKWRRDDDMQSVASLMSIERVPDVGNMDDIDEDDEEEDEGSLNDWKKGSIDEEMKKDAPISDRDICGGSIGGGNVGGVEEVTAIVNDQPSLDEMNSSSKSWLGL